MKDQSNEYIYLDGMWLQEQHLLKLAMNADCYQQAEHYLFALLAHAAAFGNSEVFDKMNGVREKFGLKAIPKQISDSEQEGKERSSQNTTADLARIKYQKLNSRQKQDLLKTCLKMLMDCHQSLFKSKASWNGIYLVVRDRVDIGLKKADFLALAKIVTPQEWPEMLEIAETTLSNFSHYLKEDDRDKAYFSMKHNPWANLCDTFWEILEGQILTGEITKDLR